MKAIKLTEKHKSKLLEMCKVLFPEWKAHFLITGETYISDDTSEFSESDETFKIHWFEFCHEYLVKKILGDYNLVFCGPNRKHPVDYLYEEFKKLEN